MTKKSAQRVARDLSEKEESLYFKTNTIYHDLEQLHAVIADHIRSYASLDVFTENHELCALLENKTKCIEAAKILKIDLERTVNTLNELYMLHKDKTGGTRDPDDYFQAIQIYQNYQKMMDAVSQTIFIQYKFLMDEFSRAEIKYNELHKEDVPPQLTPTV